mmetsp:Transcript_32951/g.77010  ORF Transcript_32951/g.77010 Transcript_32951/m.77010 type:complete len:251 (-) Transcript_32951:389-1141(-)
MFSSQDSSREANGAKYLWSISSSTSSGVLGDHFGCRSLSTSCARMPSKKSDGGTMKACAARNSARRQSASGLPRASRSSRNVTLRETADELRSTPSTPSAQSLPSRSRAASIASTLSQPKQRSIASRTPCKGATSSTAVWNLASACSTPSVDLLDSSAPCSSGSSDDGTWCVASPVYSKSAALSRSPVRPRNSPRAPGNAERKDVAPTSGKKPIFVSGIAKSADCVATRKRPCTDRPAPPPMTSPSQTDT